MYWQGDAQYYAFGLGAASYLQSRRFSRPRGMGAYKQWVGRFAGSGAGFPGVLVKAHIGRICQPCSCQHEHERGSPCFLTDGLEGS